MSTSRLKGLVTKSSAPEFKPRNPGRWQQIQATIAATTPQGYLGCAAAIINFDFTPPYPAEHIIFRSHLVDDYLEEIL